MAFQFAKNLLKRALAKRGLRIERADLRRDFTEQDREAIAEVRPYTLTSPERIVALRNAVAHVVHHDIPGAFVECGVWRGGSAMAAARAFIQQGDTSRNFYLYDTYEGMVQPSEADVRDDGRLALDVYRGSLQADGTSNWAHATLEDAHHNVASTGYPPDRLHFVKGRVEDTIPEQAPQSIAILRLDTDFYESTKHELEQLYDRIVSQGVLILDDYAEWLGSKKAVDEFIEERQLPLLLHRVDHAARIAVVP